MAKVFLGRAQIDDAVQTVAIKVLHPHLAQEADMVAMFLDEARVSIKLAHPNIVHVWDVDLIGEELVIVMEYIEGATLGQLLRAARERGEQLPVGVIARILCDALKGLHAAHGVLDDDSNPIGLVHRDVSPQNLLVGADGVTRVADFGVALSAGRLAQTQGESVKGKLRYLAPEQVLRRPVDCRLDVFSAGIVLWECLTGKRLFDGGTEAETLTQVMRQAIPPPSLSRPELPAAIDEVCLKALERDPDRRFATAEKYAEALAQAVGDKMATPEEVGQVVMDVAHDTILRHRLTLENAERPSRTGDFPSAAGVEIVPQQPKSFVRFAAVGVLCLLIGGTVVKFATGRTEIPANTTPAASAAPSSAPPAASSAPGPVASADTSGTTAPQPPTTAGAAPSAPSSAPSAQAPPRGPGARPPRPPANPRKPPSTSPTPGNSFIPPEL